MSKIYAVGLGPGDLKNMTYFAKEALDEADVFCGYTTYIKLLEHLYPDKPVISTGMTKEVQRCHSALKAASEDETVAMVCSGDAGVYGMAGLLYEISQDYPPIEIEVVPGVSAVLSGAARLGAPLGHDFAVISLSDLLTPWPLIERRLSSASSADFVLCLYNPASKNRKDYLKRACEIIMRYKAPSTICGWARNIARDDESFATLTLDEIRNYEADMFTTIFIGNAMSKIIDGKFVTPRGYTMKKGMG